MNSPSEVITSSIFLKRDDGVIFIIYNASLPLGELAFVIAHELGHILLGHDPRNTTEKEEYDASVFALLCRIPRELLEKVYRAVGFLTEDVLFNVLGNSRMRDEVARAVYKCRVALFFAYKQKRQDDEQLQSDTLALSRHFGLACS